jgi:hypothetical protein
MPKTHKMSYKHPLYTKWKAIRNRCNNPNGLDYPRYGGRGITICKEWDDYTVFYNDNIDEYNKCVEDFSGELLTTERINNDIWYINGNITFIPNRLQSKTRSCVYVFDVYKGDKLYAEDFHNLKEFCRQNNLSYDLAKYHFKRGSKINGFTFYKKKGGTAKS